MGRRAGALVLSVVIGGSLTVVSAAAPIKFAQIMRLIAAHAPDAVIAGEVASRGVAEVMDKKMIDTARAAGAGPATLAALEKIRPKSNITVAGVPGTQITVDGRSVGRIENTGTLALRDVPPGKHEIAAALSDYTPQSRVVSLGSNQSLDLEMRLKSIFGLLSVTTNAPDAVIDIEGVTRARRELVQQRLSAGPHVLKVQAPLRQLHSETIDIKSGELVERRLTLAPDPAQLAAALRRIEQQMHQRDYASVQTEATSYLAVADDATPSPSGVVSALVALADAQLHLRDVKGMATARRALESGGRFSVLVMHHHTFAPPIHAATLTVSATELSYEPNGRCTASKGMIAIARVRFSGTTISTSEGPKRAVQIKFPKPDKPSDDVTMNFLDTGDSRLDVLAELLRVATTSTLKVGPTPTPASGIPPTSAIPGRYVRQNSNDYVELKPDGTFFITQGGTTVSGTYVVSGDVLTVRDKKRTDTVKLAGNTLTDSSGFVWVKTP